MKTKLDRELQKQILERLAECYPHKEKAIENSYTSTDNSIFIANAIYLSEHGLINADPYGTPNQITSITAEITAKGLDFLAQDGGLSAILGVVTIKLHNDTIRELIEMKINQADLSTADKKKWTDGLRSLPADSIKHLTMELLSKGLDAAPGALQLVQKYISALPL